MTVYDSNDNKHRKSKTKEPIVHRPSSIDKEQLSEQDILELMGVHRDRYKRVKRRVKRK